jgi:hypothetical protein
MTDLLSAPPDPDSTRLSCSSWASRRRVVHVETRLVEKMAECLHTQTAECVMRTFGISVNTWVKLKKGEPIRASVAMRLLERLDRLEEQ